MFSGLCSLFSFPVRSLGNSLLDFLLVCFLSFLCFWVFPVRLSCVFLSSFGAFPVLLFLGLCFVFLHCFCFSPVLVISSPPLGFPSAVLGLGFVLGVALAPMVPDVAPPLFRPFVSAPRFPHAAILAAPSGLHPRFLHAAVLAAPFAFGAAPAVFLSEGSLDAIPRGPAAALP